MPRLNLTVADVTVQSLYLEYVRTTRFRNISAPEHPALLRNAGEAWPFFGALGHSIL